MTSREQLLYLLVRLDLLLLVDTPVSIYYDSNLAREVTRVIKEAENEKLKNFSEVPKTL